MELILASISPRRKELLEKAGIKFTVIPSDFNEENVSDNPLLTAQSFAFAKAKNVYDKLGRPEDKIVLGVDTVVFLFGKILGKPKSAEQAKEMLKNLSGHEHLVISGYCLLGKKIKIIGYDKTVVAFNNLTSAQIEEYVNSGLYQGKAGGYGIQDGYNLVKEYFGSQNNVIGLPTEKIFEHFKELNI
ncbi:MAG: septum formation protein Maf [Clostridia bacterium]|nr:septum formation protein Maf [Clostridia bacterium]